MNIANFFIIMLSAIAVENAVFAKGLGTTRTLFEINNLKTALLFGTTLTAITTSASFISYFLNIYTKNLGLRMSIRGVIFILAVCISYGLIAFIMRKKSAETYKRYRIMLSMASLNCSVHGALVMAAIKGLDLFGTIAYGLGSGIGFTIAVILIYNGRKRLSIANVPKAFRGLPITLIYLGLLSLAIYGLIGYQLPS